MAAGLAGLGGVVTAMPIYEYQCKQCDHVFDALQKMSDDPLQDCPECAKPELRKLLSAPNFRLKGGGWYETDFKDKNQRNLADGNNSADSSKDASASSSNDSTKTAKGAEKLGSAKSSDKPAAKPVDKAS
jgi:putative FmdB family regulatory protein